jgi:RecQ family ATP-dependent DNA helicase
MQSEKEGESRPSHRAYKDELLKKGTEFYSTGRYEEALDSYSRAALSIYTDAIAYVGMGNCLRKLERFEEALHAFEEALAIDPKCIKAHIGKCYLYVNLGRFDAAFTAYRKAVKLDPQNAAAYNAKGQILRSQKQYDEALRAFERAIELASDSDNIAGFYYNKGLTLDDQGRFDDALSAYEQAVRHNPENPKYRDAVKSLSQNTTNMMRAFERAIELASDSDNIVGFYYNKGLTLDDRGHFDDALSAYEQAVRYNPENPKYRDAVKSFSQNATNMNGRGYANGDENTSQSETFATQGHAFFRQRKLDQALIAYYNAIALQTRDAQCYKNVASILVRFHHYEGAAFRYTQALRLDPQNVSTHMEMGYLLIELELYDDALRAFNKSLQLDPHFAPGYVGKGHALFAFHRHTDALKAYADAIDLHTSDPACYINSGDILKGLHFYEEASQLYQQAIQCAPQSVAAYTGLGKTLLASGHYTDAFLAHVQAYFLDKTKSAVYQNLLDSITAISERNDALSLFRASFEKLWEKLDAQEIWSLLSLFSSVHAPASIQFGLLQHFIIQAPEGMATIEAFEKAGLCGSMAPQLELYRSGEWEAIPGFEQHPDFLFPPIVVIDVESDYAPEAEDGSRIFQIAAVRMKGHTELEHRDLIVKRKFVSPKVAHRQNEAIEPEEAARVLQKFIGPSIVVGHNIEAFDAKHLRGMDVTIDGAQIVDTLTFARLLYPDSVHHSLDLLCHEHHISFKGDRHTALPDAHACASLLIELGDEVVRRGERLLAGFQAFVPPGSAFDRAVLQPRGVPANPAIYWDLDPAPAPPRILAVPGEGSASPHIVEALEQGIDALVERYDPAGAYVQHLSSHQRAVVTIDSRVRLERMLALAQDTLDLFVLPDPQTLLCPERLRHCIEHEQRWEVQLALFCLYQASHNHDTRTLYPLRLPFEEFAELRQTLLSACCASEWRHPVTCLGRVMAQAASGRHSVLFATHEALLHWPHNPEVDLIIVDDVDTLQMHFAEYLAECLSSEQIRVRSPEVFHLLNERITSYVRHSMSSPGLVERLPLRSIMPLLIQPSDSSEGSFLSKLRTAGRIGEEIAGVLEMFCQQETQEAPDLETLHVCWLELRTTHAKGDVDWQIEQWSFCGLSQNLRQAFRERFWQPYRQHILCGTAIKLGTSGKTFLTRFFGLLEDLPFFTDARSATQVYIPPRHVIQPASYLGRRKWARSIGTFLYHLAQTECQSLVVSLLDSPVARALAQALVEVRDLTGRQVLSLQSGWTTAKIAERLADPERKTIAVVPPGLRTSVLDGAVNIEATGPLRFLNQQDPLVAAYVQLFSRLYQSENPFSSYLLPQALLELKTRLSSPASIHIILDSGLQEKIYCDEVEKLFEQDSLLKTLPELPDKLKAGSRAFTAALEVALERCGLVARTCVSAEALHQTLRTFWQTQRFREAPLNQKEIVQAALDGEDRLVIAATGGGKSLCYQLPAILMAQDSLPKVTLVISPLVALMGDQVEALKKKGIFSAIVWNSTLSGPERRNYLEGIKRGWYSIIYISPEQIHYSALRKALDTREIGLIAIDEAHCVSQWGHSFRTSYSGLKHWIETQLCNGGERYFPLMALTATARQRHKDPQTGAIERGTVQDIIQSLDLREQEGTLALTPAERQELKFSVVPIPLPCLSCQTELGVKAGTVTCPACNQSRTIQREDVEEAKKQRLIEMLVDGSERGLRLRWDRPYGQRQRGIIYCAYTATVDELAEALRADKRLAGLRVGAYHGQKKEPHQGLGDAYHRQRKSHQALKDVYDAFIRDDKEGIDIVVATNAFGMGIDVRRLGFVIHFDTPGTLEAYIQEAGRAGRDPEFQQGSEQAHCILLYHEYDLGKQRFLNEKSRLAEVDVIAVYEALRNFRKGGVQEVHVSVDDLAQLAGMKGAENDDGRSKNKVEAIIYYLEHHTHANRKPLLERREDVQTRWLLAWEHGYLDGVRHAMFSEGERQLINVFLTEKEFRLGERKVQLIDGDDLAESLEWDAERLQGTIDILRRKGILVQDTHLFIRWLKNKGEVCELITKLEQDVVSLLNRVPDRLALKNGKRVLIDVEAFAQEKRFSAEYQPIFLDFLAALSKTNAAGLRLFEHFERDSSGFYWLQYITHNQLKPTRQSVFGPLRDSIQRYAPGLPTNDWQVQNMLAEIPDPQERHRVEEYFRVLKTLGVLVLESPKENRNAMRIVFTQEDIPSDLLTIDLARLRLIERYTERKLEHMKIYAETKSEERRRSLIADYFSGTAPLLKPFTMRADLTPQQQMMVTSSGGYQLIKGPAGSGKTTLLEERVRYLVEHELVPRDHILVVAHYHSGVDRISNNVNKGRHRDKAVRAVTLNGLGESIFRTHHQHLLRSDGQPYYADAEKLNIIRDKGGEIGDTERQLLREVLANMRQQKLFPDLAHPSRAEECRKTIERLRQSGIFPSRPIDDEICRLIDHFSRLDRAGFVYDAYSRYLLLLGERGLYTYDDQILFALAILQAKPDIARTYQRLYEHILIDEYQDLTAAELQLIGILGQQYGNVMAFGDDAQDIRVKNEPKSTVSSVAKTSWSASEGGIVDDLDDLFGDYPF